MNPYDDRTNPIIRHSEDIRLNDATSGCLVSIHLLNLKRTDQSEAMKLVFIRRMLCRYCPGVRPKLSLNILLK